MLPHLDPMHILVLHCPQCPFLTLSVTRLFEHCLSHEDPVDCALYQCTHCGIVGTHLGILEEHTRAWHPSSANIALKQISRCTLQQRPSTSCDATSTQSQSHGCNTTLPRTGCLFCNFCNADPFQLEKHYRELHNVHNVQVSPDVLRLSGCKKSNANGAAAVLEKSVTNSNLDTLLHLKVDEQTRHNKRARIETEQEPVISLPAASLQFQNTREAVELALKAAASAVEEESHNTMGFGESLLTDFKDVPMLNEDINEVDSEQQQVVESNNLTDDSMDESLSRQTSLQNSFAVFPSDENFFISDEAYSQAPQPPQSSSNANISSNSACQPSGTFVSRYVFHGNAPTNNVSTSNASVVTDSQSIATTANSENHSSPLVWPTGKRGRPRKTSPLLNADVESRMTKPVVALTPSLTLLSTTTTATAAASSSIPSSSNSSATTSGSSATQQSAHFTERTITSLARNVARWGGALRLVNDAQGKERFVVRCNFCARDVRLAGKRTWNFTGVHVPSCLNRIHRVVGGDGSGKGSGTCQVATAEATSKLSSSVDAKFDYGSLDMNNSEFIESVKEEHEPPSSDMLAGITGLRLPVTSSPEQQDLEDTELDPPPVDDEEMTFDEEEDGEE